MPKKMHERKDPTKEGKARLFGKKEKPTEAEKEKVERFKKKIKEMHERVIEAAREQGIPVIDDSVYEQIDCSPEPRTTENRCSKKSLSYLEK